MQWDRQLPRDLATVRAWLLKNLMVEGNLVRRSGVLETKVFVLRRIRSKEHRVSFLNVVVVVVVVVDIVVETILLFSCGIFRVFLRVLLMT